MSGFLATVICLFISEALFAGVYEPARPLLPVRVSDDVSLSLPGTERRLALHVVFPDGAGSFPAVIVSHGTFSAGDRYDAIAAYWAARGYVVILPDHVDARRGVMPRSVADMQKIIASREADLRQIHARLAEVNQALHGFSGSIDTKNTVVAGHSVGTQAALQAAGLKIAGASPVNKSGAGFSGVLLLSDPGKMSMMPADTWRALAIPTMLVTGTADFGLMGDGRGKPGEDQQVIPASGADAALKYLLVIDGSDHYFGGLIHKDTDGPPDHEALAIANQISTAFLDATARHDPVAQEFLGRQCGGDCGSRAQLQVWP